MIMETSVLYLLLAATTLLAAASSVAIVRFHRKFLDTTAFWRSPVGAALQAAADTSQRGGEMQAELRDMRQLLEALLTREEVPAITAAGESGLAGAVSLARQGGSIADLVRSCGLNTGEAQLLLRLHGPRKGQAA